MKFMKFQPLCAELKPRLCNIYHIESLPEKKKIQGKTGRRWHSFVGHPRFQIVGVRVHVHGT